MSDIDRRSYKAAKRAWTLLEGQLMKSNDHRLNVADLFSALGGAVGPDGSSVMHAGWSSAARDRGHNVQTYDWDQHEGKYVGLMPDHRVDIMNLNADQIIDHFGGPVDVLFASPPCEGWSKVVSSKGDRGLYGNRISGNWIQPEFYRQTGGPYGGKSFDGITQEDAKRMLNQIRGTDEEYPERWADQWVANRENAIRSHQLMQRTFDIIEDLREINPDMYAFVENPLGAARYHPVTFGDWDMAAINHASYQEPASRDLFGMDPNQFSPVLPGRQVLEGLPDLKPTDIWGHFPKEWTPRPRIGDTSKNPKDDILYGSNVLYSDYPGAHEKRPLTGEEIVWALENLNLNVDALDRYSHAPELGVLAGGYPNAPHEYGSYGYEGKGDHMVWRHGPRKGQTAGMGTKHEMLPRIPVDPANIDDFRIRQKKSPHFGEPMDKFWIRNRRGKPVYQRPKSLTAGKYAGRYYAPAPAGSSGGVMGLPAISFINRAGERRTAPQYFTRSLIPYGEGLDAIIAAEKAHGMDIAPAGQAVLNPAQVIENFMRR